VEHLALPRRGGVGATRRCVGRVAVDAVRRAHRVEAALVGLRLEDGLVVQRPPIGLLFDGCTAVGRAEAMFTWNPTSVGTNGVATNCRPSEECRPSNNRLSPALIGGV
jgi:hypothetical protein